MQQMRWKPLRVSPLPQHCAPGPAWALSGTCQMMGREKVVAGSILVHCWHIIQLSAKKSGEREKRSRCTVSAEPLQSQSPGAGACHSACCDRGQLAQPLFLCHV